MRYCKKNGVKRAFPFEGSEARDAGVNDSPVGCQSRVLTEPRRVDKVPP